MRQVDVRLLSRMGPETKVLNRLTGVLGPPQQDSVGASWCPQGELVESDSLTTGSNNPGTSRCSKPQRSNGELGDGQGTVVVSDSSNNNDGLVELGGLFMGDILEDPRDGDWWAVYLGHEKTAEDHLIKVGVGSPCQGNLISGSFGDLILGSVELRTYWQGTCRP